MTEFSGDPSDSNISFFLWVFKRIKIPQGENNLVEWWNFIVSLDVCDPDFIYEQIKQLDAMLPTGEEWRSDAPFISMFLGHCCNLIYYLGDNNYKKHVEPCISDAAIGFQVKYNHYGYDVNDYNRAIAYLYLGLHHFFENPSNQQEEYLENMSEAGSLLRKLYYKHHENGRYEICDEIQGIQKLLQTWLAEPNPPVIPKTDKEQIKESPPSKNLCSSTTIEGTPISKGHLFKKNPLETNKFPMIRDSQKGTDKSFTRQQINLRLPESQKTKRRPVHLIVPVDTQALRELNTDSIPLGQNLTDLLWQYTFLKDRRSLGGKLPKRNSENGVRGNEKKYVVPPLPVFGFVTAGPDGKAIFSEPLGNASEVDEDGFVSFGSLDYRVFSTKENNNRINTISGNRYGWLIVEGDSMTNAKPVPIDNQDYILFCENCVVDSLIGKIIVASLPDTPPRLLIKRLWKTGPDLFLRSESNRFFRDLKITDEYQITGEVIAVAKPS